MTLSLFMAMSFTGAAFFSSFNPSKNSRIRLRIWLGFAFCALLFHALGL